MTTLVEDGSNCVSRNGGRSTSGGWRQGEPSAALSTLMLSGFTFQAPLLSLFAAGDAVGAREIGGAQMKKTAVDQLCHGDQAPDLHC